MPAAEWIAMFGPFDDEGNRWDRGLDKDQGAARRPPGPRRLLHPLGGGDEHEIEASALPISADEVRRARSSSSGRRRRSGEADRGGRRDEGQGLGRARIGAGAGPEMNRYGGNTSCVEVTLSDGER